MDFPEVKPNEYVVRVMTEPDGMDRVRFAAFWLCEVQGVRGQMFHTQLDKFTADAAHKNYTVRIEAAS